MSVTRAWGQLPARDRTAVLERDDYTCQYCSKRPKMLSRPCGSPFGYRQRRTATLHVDHMIAVSKGGSHDIANLVTACAECNLAKHAKAWDIPIAYCCECGEFTRNPTSVKILPEAFGEPLFWCGSCRARNGRRIAATEIYDWRDDIDIEVAAWDAIEFAYEAAA